MRRWRKLGQLFTPEGRDRHPLLLTHAANPLAVRIEDDLYRVYFSGRDAANRSSVGAVEIDVVRRRVERECRAPLFTFGPDGSFYSHGVSVGNCYEAGGARYMLFMGWQVPPGGHWRGDVGRLRVADDGSLSLAGTGPFLSSTAVDPVSLSYPWVLRMAEADYRMWYGSTHAWEAGNGEMLHVLNGAHSADGHSWVREGLAVPYAMGRAQAFSRPTVAGSVREGYVMWFSYRSGTGKPYRIGRATSPDARAWSLYVGRPDIDVSPGDWDGDMIQYPFVFDHAGERYMLYNGNGFGRTGFGLAVLER